MTVQPSMKEDTAMSTILYNIFLLSLYTRCYGEGISKGKDDIDNTELEHVKLLLFSRPNSTIPQFEFKVNESHILQNGSFERSHSLAIVVHGFQGSVNQSLFQQIKNAYLDKGGWNVIMVDWELLSKVARYEVAVGNAFSVATMLAQWLSDVHAKEFVDLNRTHIVGFSIGAHIAGNAAKRVRDGKVAKIFALDPAFPIYEIKNDSERLHREDANFVQVIHTCGHSISYETSLGHVDFYPNGGKFPQPDCLDLKAPEAWGLEIISAMVCSHNVVLRYFVETIYDEYKFTALRCDSWHAFRNGNCSSEAVPMGYATPINVRGDYYLKARLKITSRDLM